MVVIHMMRMVQYKYSTDFKFSFFFGRKNKGFTIMVTFPAIIFFFCENMIYNSILSI